jgi:hypothetical protein
MDLQSVVNAGFVVISAVLGWFGRELWGATKELKADLAKLREDIPKEYVSKVDFKDDLREIKTMLEKQSAVIEKLFDKLDQKVDRDYR